MKYDDSKAFGNLPDGKKIQFQCVDGFVNNHPVPIAVQAVTGPVEKKCNSFPCSAIPTDTKSQEVTTFTNLGEKNGMEKQSFSEEIPVENKHKAL